jgi:RNA polymerase sigma-70 factor (ECF subfamily)
MGHDQLDRLYERLLVVRCQAGDEAAFAEFVERYHARLRRFLRRMLGEQQADDALQDVWLDVWRSIGRLEDVAAAQAWVFRIARDRAYRVLRRRSAIVPTVTIDERHTTVPDERDDGLDPDDRQLLNKSLDAIGHEHREVLLLRFIEQMTYDQIAVAVGCEIGTVRSRLHYAKRALRDHVERKTQ